MRTFLVACALLATPSFSNAQESPDTKAIVDGINRALGHQEAPTKNFESLSAKFADRKAAEEFFGLMNAKAATPQWGIVVKDASGQAVDVFGQVPYQVTKAGIQVPGFDPPPGGSLAVVPQGKWNEVAEAVAATASSLKDSVDPSYAPITAIPAAMDGATEYLAMALCGKKSRPTEITLSLMVSASGSIFIAEASSEAGSTVMWNLPTDVCPRYGLKRCPAELRIDNSLLRLSAAARSR